MKIPRAVEISPQDGGRGHEVWCGYGRRRVTRFIRRRRSARGQRATGSETLTDEGYAGYVTGRWKISAGTVHYAADMRVDICVSRVRISPACALHRFRPRPGPGDVTSCGARSGPGGTERRNKRGRTGWNRIRRDESGSDWISNWNKPDPTRLNRIKPE